MNKMVCMLSGMESGQKISVVKSGEVIETIIVPIEQLISTLQTLGLQFSINTVVLIGNESLTRKYKMELEDLYFYVETIKGGRL